MDLALIAAAAAAEESVSATRRAHAAAVSANSLAEPYLLEMLSAQVEVANKLATLAALAKGGAK